MRLIEEIEAFQKLPAGWDSHGAAPISKTAVAKALRIVETLHDHGAPAPSATPTPLGGVALIWLLRDIEIEFLIEEGGLWYSVARRESPEVLQEGPISEPEAEQSLLTLLASV